MKFALLFTVFALPAMLSLPACSSTESAAEADIPALSMTVSRNDMLVGETATFFANTSNMLGRNAQVNWRTTQGRIEPERDGRIARFTAENPGTAIVTAEVTLEDGTVLRDSETIDIRAIK